ncbi:hypothetical protein ES703_57463 [subsurface metagenome]
MVASPDIDIKTLPVRPVFPVSQMPFPDMAGRIACCLQCLRDGIFLEGHKGP